MRSHKWRPQMTPSERKRGWVFFALYLLVFPYLTGWVQRLWEGEAPIAETNLVYYALLFALALLVFWTFLRHGFTLLVDWLPENLFAFFTGLVGAGVLHFLVMLLPYPVANPMYADYAQQYLLSPGVTVMLVVVLIPLIEEILFRGLVFGALRQRSRLLAYGVSILLFALAAVWRYAMDFGDARYLVLAIQYLPAGLALAWCYDNGGSIWGTVALRMAMNGVMLFMLVR